MYHFNLNHNRLIDCNNTNLSFHFITKFYGYVDFADKMQIICLCWCVIFRKPTAFRLPYSSLTTVPSRQFLPTATIKWPQGCRRMGRASVAFPWLSPSLGRCAQRSSCFNCVNGPKRFIRELRERHSNALLINTRIFRNYCLISCNSNFELKFWNNIVVQICNSNSCNTNFDDESLSVEMWMKNFHIFRIF